MESDQLSSDLFQSCVDQIHYSNTSSSYQHQLINITQNFYGYSGSIKLRIFKMGRDPEILILDKDQVDECPVDMFKSLVFKPIISKTNDRFNLSIIASMTCFTTFVISVLVAVYMHREKRRNKIIIRTSGWLNLCTFTLDFKCFHFIHC